MKTSVCIGVISFNNPLDDLDMLIRSVRQAVANARDLEVMILCVDNGEARFGVMDPAKTGFKLFPPQGNIGFARMSNLLMNEAFGNRGCDAYICLNPDGAMHRQCLSELAIIARAHPDALVEARQFPEEHPKIYDPATLDTPWATGACLWIPRSVHAGIGGFDERFFLYHEDVDYSWRARLAGFDVKVAPKALFAHHILAREPDRRRERLFLETWRALAHKWGEDGARQDIERRLLSLGHVSGPSELPPLQQRPQLPAGAAAIVDLSPCYAPSRW